MTSYSAPVKASSVRSSKYSARPSSVSSASFSYAASDSSLKDSGIKMQRTFQISTLITEARKGQRCRLPDLYRCRLLYMQRQMEVPSPNIRIHPGLKTLIQKNGCHTQILYFCSVEERRLIWDKKREPLEHVTLHIHQYSSGTNGLSQNY